MKIEEMFDLLNEDLSREYSHWNYYLHSSVAIKSLHRQEIGEFLLEQASEEMKHVEQFGKLLNGLICRRNLNKNVSTDIKKFKNNLSCPKLILEEALRMEDEVVLNYINRIEDAQKLQLSSEEDRIDGRYIELFLEDQIVDSRTDADHIRMMLSSF